MSMLLMLTGLLALGLLIDTGSDAPDADPPDETDPDQIIPGTAGSDLIDGGSGNDLINSLAGNDTVNGNAGDDTILGGPDRDIISGGDGDDEITAGAGNDALIGGAGNDLIDGGAGGDRIDGNTGDDTLIGGQGNDTINGGIGDDSLLGGDGDDRLFGVFGMDTLIGGDGNDTLSSNAYQGNPAADGVVMDGGAGNDYFTFGLSSTITGGDGADQISYVHTPGNDHTVTLTDFDPMQDTLEINVLGALEGTPELQVVDWADGTGATILYGDEVAFEATGAAGLDPAEIAIRIRLDGGTYTDGNASTDISALDGNSTISGGDGNDSIYAYDGGDPSEVSESLINGDAGDDTLWVQGGSFDQIPDGIPETFDPFVQIHADNQVFGGDGNDTLISINGNEVTGGEGADTFAVLTDFDIPGQPGLVPFDASVITDFDPTEDRMVVSTRSLPDGVALGLAISVWADGLGADIIAGGRVVAEVTGGQTLSVADITIISDGFNVPYSEA